ncbi:Gpr1p [Sugiyamaella lignohabitans]|uniref:Gpr1p n=1 Tax=Sugiyamaella lignohabitans TaxID=796027 RepID=A0A167BYT3_9ASCO|nr:Gpr1p [Sugiyamaella lignohabitans]ANB10994.1 Gpr1p [Sugiyamaella lignohabitans]
MSDYYDSDTSKVNNYSAYQALVLRWVSVSSSCLSIVFGLAALYFYTNMKTKVFRHHLILLLLLFDFGKAVVLLWYPARVLLVASAYDNINFCDVVGFFTSAFIEGADLAVLALAIHTALLIFKKYKGPEGGLYRYRYWVYALTIIIPLIMAALVFVEGRKSYRPYITWCYLPVRPLWYRLVLSWIPRYIIIVTIVSIYVAIYIYVKLQYREVVRNFSQSQSYVDKYDAKLVGKGIRPRFRRGWRMFKAGTLSFLSYFPGFAFLATSNENITDSPSQPIDVQANTIAEFQRASMADFQFRRSVIERQIRSIFVYPTAYVFLWLAPFALQCLQFRSDLTKSTVFWVNAIAAFMQPFNCVVDTIAFFIRETPWRNREERVFKKETGRKILRGLSIRRTDGCKWNSSRSPSSPSSDKPSRNTQESDLYTPDIKGGYDVVELQTRGRQYSNDDIMTGGSSSTNYSPKHTVYPPFPGNELVRSDNLDAESDADIDIFEFLKGPPPHP